jgi:phosphoribosylglycinamide formyltransferase-1
MKNIVCLISGRGSNLQALLAAQGARRWPEAAPAQAARVSAVIANRAQARGLQIAREAGVAAELLEHGAYPTREAFDAALAQRIDAHDPALVVLAGFLRVLTPGFVARYEGRLINIHPSLLPAFPGLETHARAVAAGVRIHGSTVHYVTSELDAGPIIAQAALGVEPGEDAQALAARVLALEHVLLPRCVEWIIQGRVRLAAGRVATEGLRAADLLVGP